MHSNLMRASGVELDFHQRCVVDLCERFPIRARLARIGDGRTMPRFALRRHARSMNRVASDCQINAAAFLRKNALHQRDIRLLDGALAKRVPEFCVRHVVLGHQDHARSLLVQTMHDSRPQRIATL